MSLLASKEMEAECLMPLKNHKINYWQRWDKDSHLKIVSAPPHKWRVDLIILSQTKIPYTGLSSPKQEGERY